MCYGCNFRYFKEGGHKESYSSFQSQLHIVFQPVKRNIPVESYLDTCESKEWKERVCLDDIKQVLENLRIRIGFNVFRTGKSPTLWNDCNG